MESICCQCGLRARVCTSWTKNNPSRRFLGCPRYGSKGACGFFMWVDPPAGTRVQEVINGLLRRIVVIEDQVRLHRGRERKLLIFVVMLWIFFLWCYLTTEQDGEIAGSNNDNDST
ncbi:uncharacterized protein LOC114301019 [Camellia sinensis]|uniref:uncharacterized protein LOC114301019 n=1 Tax=Camellia sinensis TaxID=4442 RepID=UPI0010361386|nr:uncharacterized protein LOC114301019 [Camellia sinensis]XP_028101710.1 uncharacterized protein LOC114301019 [Camellia sinensis]